MSAFAIIMLLANCKLATDLSYNRPTINSSKHFLSSLRYNNRKSSHRPVAISITVFGKREDNYSADYVLFFEENKLIKKERIWPRQHNLYVLTRSAGHHVKFRELPLNNIDSAVIERMKYFLDSLKLPKADIVDTGNTFKIAN